MRFRDVTVPIEERVQDLIEHLTLEEKAGLLVMKNEGVERLGIGFYHWWNEALHGYARCGVATVFPQAIGLAASWSPATLHTVGSIAATEGRAKNNRELAENNGNSRSCYGTTIWSPNINIFRDPRWGRGQETYGEDPFLTAMLANRFVRGLQGDDPKHLKCVATLKHFAVHSGPEPLRHQFDAKVSEKDLRDTYLPAFEEGIRFGKAKSVMSAYNGFNGSPCVVSHRLLTEILRDEWGFDGAVVGDVDNVHDLFRDGGHGWAETGAEAMAAAIKAGNELRSGGGSEHALEAVEQGLLTEADIDVALTRLLKLRFLLGHFDPPEEQQWAELKTAIIECHAHVTAAYEASKDSLVLLKNDGILPLKSDGLKSVAVVGPTADDLEVLQGNYSGTPYEPVTILEGLKRKLEPSGVKVLAEQSIPFAHGYSNEGKPIPPGVFFTDAEATTRGLTCRMYDAPEPTGEPVVEQVDSAPALEWNTALPRPSQLTGENARVVWSGFMKIDCEGIYTFYTRLRGRSTIQIGDCEEFNSYRKLRIAGGSKQLSLPGGSIVPITITWEQVSDEAFFTLEWDPADGGAREEEAHQSALTMAKKADVVILTLGLSHKLEGEEMQTSPEGFHRGDRTTIALPAPQQRLLDDVAAMSKPTVLLLSTGSAVAFDPAGANAVMQTWYYGAQGGLAVADALFGEFSPAGRLPVTFYASDDDLPDFEDYSMEDRTYRYFVGDPLYAFGHGLTYTSFEYSDLSVAKVEEGLEATLKVTNTGDCESDEVVQIYASRDDRDDGDPLQWLVGFQRLRELEPGEAAMVMVSIPNRWLALWSDESGKRAIKSGPLKISVGPSSDNLVLHETVNME